MQEDMLKSSLVLVAFKYVFELLLQQNQEKNIAAGHREIQCQYTGSKYFENGKHVLSRLPDWNQGDNLSFTTFLIGSSDLGQISIPL